MSRAVVGSLVFAAVFLCAGPAQSHHSNVEYEVTKVITVTGVVTEFECSNPHTWLHLTVDDAKDGKMVWLCEGRVLGILLRPAWVGRLLNGAPTATSDIRLANKGHG